MRIYIVGISGMLGSKLFNEFIKSKRLIVRGSSRKLPKIFNDNRNYIDLNSDVYNLDLLNQNLKKFNPFVVNFFNYTFSR